MSRAVFVAVGVYNWDPTTPAETTFSLTNNGPKKTIDSTKRPAGGQSVVGALVDDDAGGATSVTSVVQSGGVYIEQEYAANKGYSLPPKGYDSLPHYEFMTIQYSNTHAKYARRRYYGFHAIWTGGDRNNATLLIFNAGDSKSKISGAVIRNTLDLDDDKLVLPENEMPSGGLPVLGEGKGGGIFLRCSEAENLGLLLPKLPQVLGSQRIKCPSQDI